MNEKKHIDRLFQESFKDFEASPSDAVWTNIEAELKAKKKKRRIIPLWWRYAGVAALLLLFLSIGGFYVNNSENTSNNKIVDIDDNPSKTDAYINENRSSTSTKIENNAVASDEKFNQVESKIPFSSKAQPAVVASSSSESIIKTVASTSKNSSQSNSNKNNYVDESIVPKNSSNTIATSGFSESKPNISSETMLVDQKNQKELISGSSENNIAFNESIKETKEVEVKEQPESANALTIEEALDKNKAVIPDNKPENRWSVAPNVAPVYFNTLNEGSSIDRQFDSNSKTGDVNMSYGISTSYAINKKFKVRSGINKVNLGYNTNDVIIFRSNGASSSALTNIDETNTPLAVAGDEALKTSAVSNAVVSTNSSINQSFGYIEVPLEIQYTFVDKRLGVNVIGGFSSFFLDNNEIYSERENGARTYLGEANNINDISYSANLGLGLNYKFSKKIDLNLEPTFKYQFNTFNNTSGDFTPFFIGVYTGFAIKF